MYMLVPWFCYGHRKEGACLYPGSVTGIEKSCNVLSLEVEQKTLCSETKTEDMGGVSFQELDVGDRVNLLELVTSHVGLHVVEPLKGKLFPTLLDNEGMLLERRSMLIKMHKFGRYWESMNLEYEGFCYNLTQGDLKKIWKKLGGSVYLNGRCVARQSFISSGDTFVLSLKASSYTEEESSFRRYRGWPKIDLARFFLYKLPVKNPIGDHSNYAGLWGGTFGWPPSKSIKDETGKAFYLLRLTYEESQRKDNERHLIGTKILEGTHYAKRPNGSPMFVVNILKPSLEPFPFDADERDFGHSYKGKGISQMVMDSAVLVMYPVHFTYSLLIISHLFGMKLNMSLRCKD